MSNANFPGNRWSWRYDELKQIGTDYSDMAEVESYDRKMQAIRNVQKEVQDILNMLRLERDQTVLEIGTGTGEFAIAASRHCSKVIATDISQAMLDYASQKAQSRGVGDIDFRLAGFLTYEHSGPKLDAIVTQLALHHLPDFWKQVALLRIHDMLKEGGKFFLMDVVYSFDIGEYEKFFDGYVAEAAKADSDTGMDRSMGRSMGRSIASHISEENSTSRWIMEGLLEHAGLKIEMARYANGFIATYLCTREE